MRISDWSSDWCSSDLFCARSALLRSCSAYRAAVRSPPMKFPRPPWLTPKRCAPVSLPRGRADERRRERPGFGHHALDRRPTLALAARSEEHTSELQSLMRISYAVFCLKKKKNIAVLATMLTRIG